MTRQPVDNGQPSADGQPTRDDRRRRNTSPLTTRPTTNSACPTDDSVGITDTSSRSKVNSAMKASEPPPTKAGWAPPRGRGEVGGSRLFGRVDLTRGRMDREGAGGVEAAPSQVRGLDDGRERGRQSGDEGVTGARVRRLRSRRRAGKVRGAGRTRDVDLAGRGMDRQAPPVSSPLPPRYVAWTIDVSVGPRRTT